MRISYDSVGPLVFAVGMLVLMICVAAYCQLSIEQECINKGVVELLTDKYYCIPDKELPKSFDRQELLKSI